MKYSLMGILSLMFYLFSSQLPAVSVYECEDADGNKTFQERCPPGTTAVQEKKFLTGKKQSSNPAADINATLYSVPECDACQDIRDFLTLRGISFTDKNVNDNAELQNELKELAGELKVPVIVVGESILKGYNRTELLNALKTAGYVEPEQENPAPEAAEATAEPADEPLAEETGTEPQ